MASISRGKNGRRMIQFVGADGKRRSIRLGKVSQRVAESVKVRIEQLVAAKISGHAPDDETARWVAQLDTTMLDKLAAVGLIPKRKAATLGDFLDSYINSRCDVKPRTRAFYEQVRDGLLNHFGSGKPLREVSPGDADGWRLHLLSNELAENTVRRRCGQAKQFFTAAMRRRLIPDNPFAGIKSAVQANRIRFFFVTPEQAEKVIEACPDAQWRLLFALSRYGGLRCPSEHLNLRWGDVDWEHGRITVTSPKTEHHPGGASRIIPLFPELLPYLRDCFELAEPGAEFVITRYRSTNANLRTQLLRIIKRAGLKPWPKLFQNLRSTRQTELEETFPSHVVCTWIGNSQPIAQKHYLQVTQDHFEKALQNPVQQPAVSARNDSQADPEEHEKTPVLPGVAAECGQVHIGQVRKRGLEPPRTVRSTRPST